MAHSNGDENQKFKVLDEVNIITLTHSLLNADNYFLVR